MKCPCINTCLVSFAFIISMIYFYNATQTSQVVQQYKASLSSKLKERYEKISKQRQRISYYGYALGLILSLITIMTICDKTSILGKVCVTIVITFLTNYFYYILSPKQDWLLYHLVSKEEITAWLAMYREMQKSYHMGIVLGIIGAGIMAYAFR